MGIPEKGSCEKGTKGGLTETALGFRRMQTSTTKTTFVNAVRTVLTQDGGFIGIHC